MVRQSQKIAFLFPGQGAQYPGMGLDLPEASAEAKKIFTTASEVLGRDMARVIRDSDAETLQRTDIAQTAISAVSLAAAAFLRERGIVPAACAGFSLGEYPALACAGVIGIADCFRLTGERGRAMQAAADRLRSDAEAAGMAAVIGLPPGQIEALIAGWKNEKPQNSVMCDLYAANYNSPKQTVVSGSAAALAEAESRFREAGARRFIRLQVAGPFHSPFMREAAQAFAPALEKTTFRDPVIPFFSNVTGKQVLSGDEAKKLALLQITEPVRWVDEEASVAACGIEACLETGPGKVLQGLWKDSGSDIPVFAAGTAEDSIKGKKL